MLFKPIATPLIIQKDALNKPFVDGAKQMGHAPVEIPPVAWKHAKVDITLQVEQQECFDNYIWN